MALNSAGITAAIAALNISGVTIKDVTAIPQQVTNRDCPILFPFPNDWISGGKAAADETTFGTPSTRLWHVHRTFTYLYLHSAVGAGRELSDYYSGAVTKLENITSAITTLDVSGVDVETIAHTGIGVLQDAAGNKFTGCQFDITLQERINA
jgi:hypothetical protein